MQWFIYATALILGLLAGSFLNVVIYRAPAMLGLEGENRRARGDLIAPRSHCPACRTQIRNVDLIPLFSFVALRGKCRACGAPIPLRYPIVELLGAVAALSSIFIFDATLDAGFAALFFLALIALGAIDHETGYLPDAITLPLIALGLAANIYGRFAAITDAVIGAALGYLVFALIAFGYERLRGREGLGGGDAKLLAAIGAWGGWMILAPTVFIGALLALSLIAASSLSGRKLDMTTPVRFGPALCLAGAAAFIALRLGLPLFAA
ncbi:MAG TPA: prepilin peptidase [Parvularculaceae bacterium]|nr:prepilin peptidase [Parvularculaceae bacterium]